MASVERDVIQQGDAVLICRYWEAVATAENADLYIEAATTKVIPSIEARNIEGFRHIDVLRYPLPDGNVRFVTLMWFDNIDAIRKFVGEDAEASYLPPDITAVLSSYAPRAIHYDVVARRGQT